jgi:polyphosphate kinase 2 (PPK2 family)
MSKQPSQSLSLQLKRYVEPFRFDGSGEFHLKSYKTSEKGGLDKEKAEKILEANKKRLNDFQEKLYAQDRWSLLLILQGMDAAGKDSVIKNIFDGVNPQGCEVTSFKQPSTLELNHDFMWRCVVALPARGHIGIFNRSYYEECLVTRVHPELLAKEKIPRKLITSEIWRERFEDISAFERYLARNGIVVLKFFLNLSKGSSACGFSTGWSSPRRTGNSRWPTSPSARCGHGTWRCIRTSSATPRPPWRRGTWCRPITNGSRGW